MVFVKLGAGVAVDWMGARRLLGFFAAALPFSVIGCSSPSIGGGSGGSTSSGGVSSSTGGTTTSGAAGNSTGGTSMTSGSGADGALGPWVLTSDYPLAAKNCAGTSPNLYCAQQTCFADSGYVYCVGGLTTSTYFSQLSSAGLGQWSPSADYPQAAEEQSCVVSSGYVYCVGGYIAGVDGGPISPIADVYYAPLLSPGIGTWVASTPFPHVTGAAQCMTDSGYIYCITRNSGGSALDAYYAPLSSSGVGAWAPTAAPPKGTAGCATIGGYVYCFGGAGCPPNGPMSDCYSPSYFAPLSASGIGTWKTTSQLPTAVFAEYATAGSYIYYLSIPAFFASVSADGIGPWQTTTNYPDSSYPSACFSSGNYLYCANPNPNGSYFARIGAPNPQALQIENPPPFERAQYLLPAWINGGGCSVSVNGVLAGAPCFGKNIDDAVVFDCASQASAPQGCTTTVVSSDTSYNYDVTVRYPCTTPNPDNTNCCFQPALGYPSPLYAWCSSVGSNSFIVEQQITLQQGQ